MAQSFNSLFVPTESPMRPQDTRRYDRLAKEQGWTKEQLRKCGDLPKKTLPSGVKVVRMPPDVLTDPFKNATHTDGEEEYNALEARFYEKLMHIKKKDKHSSSHTSGNPSISTKTAKTVIKKPTNKEEEEN